MVTSRDVARIAGVSQATVSRVLHNSKNVSPATRKKVRKALDDTGYAPNAAARAMRTNKTSNIGVVVELITNPFYPEVLLALGQELAKHDRRMLLWDLDGGAGEAGAIEAIEQRLVDGLVFTTATAGSGPLSRAIVRGAPVVLINRVVEHLPCDQVDSENAATSADIAEYFLRNGHSRLALIDGPSEASTARHRREGFISVCERAGIDMSDRIVGGGFSHRGGHTAFLRLMDHPDPPTAVFAVNDLSGFGAIDAARHRGIAVPEDVWVAGFDDIDMASWEGYSLTTAHQRTAEMIEAGLALLLERIEDPSKPTIHQRFKADLVVRNSTADIPVDSEEKTWST